MLAIYNTVSILTIIIYTFVIIVLINNFNKEQIAKRFIDIFQFIALIISLSFIVYYWITIDRTPLRTLWETRLWYAFFTALIATIFKLYWKMNYMLIYGNFITIIFILVNLLHPENFSKELMPALQSYWFIPHVIVYIFSYALFGIVTIMAIFNLIPKIKFKADIKDIDNIIYIGLAFLTLGLVFGALWAKEAWGSYWTWDPKEIWAMITWVIYLLYVHYRYGFQYSEKFNNYFIITAFVLLLICWFGINYLPVANQSVHTYTN
ncbi:MAG TPA: cytochrome c biogenesis protein CcsA [Ignavibacteriales bacterium]|nr:cytochrome c biogenesis protein CcsA [Ignavibacteriales bacterium]HOL80849.1 cytochrome c biogenesis protein CcsA [Ignavibacteriales bacterium]HOM65875.1 cytochrome c biogenesis protein CcsA [Ignavibacteriales bacterium]HPD67631.1 cytochrome c biogenesis protein CcsA [Ignavibacteriales bacterium]HPP33284.1 cytochrome c biogenesis protein CcsA [Ignavibacteriales bacterium]